MTHIGFIGSGHIGSQLARLAVANGHTVTMSNSRGPETLTHLVSELGDGATAGTVRDAAANGDIVVVTVPLAGIESVPADILAGKTVIDTNNYYFERDGHIEALDSASTTVSQLLQDHLPQSSVVKAFNNINFGDLTSDGTPEGTPDRRALPIAGDSAEAKATVAALINDFGFDVLDSGSLADSWRFERDMPAYGVRTTLAELQVALDAAERSATPAVSPTAE
jgi:predicted dinucleotide-binding enzyme